ncbi:MAG TPA: hypothetical protein VN851_04710 [Thermoanaerobaculia bacterium]|nr:hypothetical protein [Thermoanaerobaculia bacterium]
MKRKLQLHRDTIVRLTSIDMEGAYGGAAGTRDASCAVGSCAFCTQYRSCAPSCGGTCFEISCAPAACTF